MDSRKKEEDQLTPLLEAYATQHPEAPDPAQWLYLVGEERLTEMLSAAAGRQISHQPAPHEAPVGQAGTLIYVR